MVQIVGLENKWKISSSPKLNKFICVGDKSVYFRNLAEKGIFRVGDLISNKHELIIKSELRVLNLSPLGLSL